MPDALPNPGAGPLGTLPPGPKNPTASDVGAVLSVEQAWHSFMTRRGVYVPKSIQSAANILHGVDLITKRRSK